MLCTVILILSLNNNSTKFQNHRNSCPFSSSKQTRQIPSLLGFRRGGGLLSRGVPPAAVGCSRPRGKRGTPLPFRPAESGVSAGRRSEDCEGESQNHRIVGVGRDLCGSSSPTRLPKQGHLQQAAQDLVQAGLEYLQRRRLHNLPGQPGPGLRHPQREENGAGCVALSLGIDRHRWKSAVC